MIGKKIEINKHKDIRGILMAINDISVKAERIFFIYDVPVAAVRGNHFSKTSSFVYVLVKGGCKVELDNGFVKENYDLHAGDGLMFLKNTWMKLYGFEEGTVLCVIADTPYKSSDYIDDYNEFLRSVRKEDV